MKKESSRRNKLEEEVTPGPAEYNPNFQLMRVGRSISFGYSKRFGDIKEVRGRIREEGEEKGGRRRREEEEKGRGGREEYSYINSSFFDGPKYR